MALKGLKRDSYYLYAMDMKLKRRTQERLRALHELFSKNGVPHPIPAGLEFLRKLFLAWRFKQYRGIPFYMNQKQSQLTRIL